MFVLSVVFITTGGVQWDGAVDKLERRWKESPPDGMEMRKWEYSAAYWFRWMEMYCIQSSVILLVFGHFFLNFFYFILNINIKKIIEYN